MDAAAKRLCDAAHSLLRSLATAPLGEKAARNSQSLTMEDLLTSPEIQELSDAADAMERQ